MDAKIFIWLDWAAKLVKWISDTLRTFPAIPRFQADSDSDSEAETDVVQSKHK